MTKLGKEITVTMYGAVLVSVLDTKQRNCFIDMTTSHNSVWAILQTYGVTTYIYLFKTNFNTAKHAGLNICLSIFEILFFLQ